MVLTLNFTIRQEKNEFSSASLNWQWQKDKVDLGIIFQALFVYVKQGAPRLRNKLLLIWFKSSESPSSPSSLHFSPSNITNLLKFKV